MFLAFLFPQKERKTLVQNVPPRRHELDIFLRQLTIVPSFTGVIRTGNDKPKFIIFVLASNEFFNTFWAVDLDGFSSILQSHCLQESQNTNTMIPVQMCNENFHFFIPSKV